MYKDRTNTEQSQGVYDERVGTIFKASGGLFVACKCAKTVPRRYQGSGLRGNISAFSPRAASRMRQYLRGCMAEYTHMVTLTYPGFYESNGKAVKEHLRRFLQELRRSHDRTNPHNKFSAFWFLEFQKRGAPHFHIFTTYAESRQWISRRWYEIVNSEDERHLHAGTNVERLRSGRGGTLSYASKYAAKLEQKTVPSGYENVGRFWGVTGRRAVMSADVFVSTADLGKPGVVVAMNKLRNAMNMLVSMGEAQLIKREDGLVLANLLTEYAQRKMRARVSELIFATMRFSDIFDDAELED